MSVTYYIHIDDTIIEWEMNPNDFRFMCGYSDTNIYPVGITIDEIMRGITLYKSYDAFKQAMQTIYEGPQWVLQSVMNALCDSLNGILTNPFIQWLELDMSVEEVKMLTMNRIPPAKLNGSFNLNDCILEYYWAYGKHPYTEYSAFEQACRQNHASVVAILCKHGKPEKVMYVNNSRLLQLCFELKHYDLVKVLVSCDTTNKLNIHMYNESLIRDALFYKQIEVAQWMLTLEPRYGKFNLHVENEKLLRNCVYSGSYELVKWMISLESTHEPFNIHAVNEEMFVVSCQYGSLDIAQYLISLEPTHGRINVHAREEAALITPNINVLKWLLSLDISKYGRFNVHVRDDAVLCLLCRYGNYTLEDVQWFVNHVQSDPSYGPFNFAKSFEVACANNNFEVAKWLYEQGSDLTQNVTNMALQLVSKKFNPEQCQMIHWLLTILSDPKIVKIHANKEAIFEYQCTNGNVDCVKMLISLEDKYGKFNIHVQNRAIIMNTLINGHLEVLQYLTSLESTHGRIDWHAANDKLFCLACQHKHNHIAQWMLQNEALIGPTNIQAWNNISLRTACRQQNSELVALLLERGSYTQQIMQSMLQYCKTLAVKTLIELYIEKLKTNGYSH